LAGWKKVKEYLKKVVKEDGDERKIALGFAIGVFISFTPFFSIHTILAIILSILLRLNKIATIAGAWVNNPYTVPFVYYASYKFGALILGWEIPPPDFHNFNLDKFVHYVKIYGVPLLLGTTILGVIAGFISFYVMLYSIRTFREKKPGGDE